MNTAATHRHPHDRTGLLIRLGAYGLWGVLPLYFKAIEHVPAFDIVAHRVLWSLPLLALLITAAKGLPASGWYWPIGGHLAS